MFKICFCGFPETNHNFRHTFVPSIDVCRNDNIFTIDALQYKSTVDGDKCAMSQCGMGKILHDPKADERKEKIKNGEQVEPSPFVIKHVFQPSKIGSRCIRFTLPLDTKCQNCDINLEKHNSLTHPFTTRVNIKNLSPHDRVLIKGKGDQTIIWK